MITKNYIETRAVFCLLAQGDIQPPLCTLTIRIDNVARNTHAARLLLGIKH